MQRIRELNGQFDFQNKLEYIQNVQMGYPYQFSSANQIQNSVPMPNISIASQNQIIPQNIDIQTKIELQKQIVIQKKIELKKQIGDLKQMEKQKKKEDQKQLKNQQLKQLRELQKQKKHVFTAILSRHPDTVGCMRSSARTCSMARNAQENKRNQPPHGSNVGRDRKRL